MFWRPNVEYSSRDWHVSVVQPLYLENLLNLNSYRSGTYLSIQKGNHHKKKHPDRPWHSAPYHIDVSTTLVISGITLLVTLVGLLIAVPLRKWKMDKLVGWGAIALWTASTIGNVLIEVLGVGSSSIS